MDNNWIGQSETDTESAQRPAKRGLNWRHSVFGIMAMIVGFSIAVAIGTATGAGDDGSDLEVAETTPEPRGEQHVINVARNLSILDPIEDEALLGAARATCKMLDTGSTFNQVADVIDDGMTGDAETVAFSVAALSGVPAFCPQWLDELETWGDEMDSELSKRAGE